MGKFTVSSGQLEWLLTLFFR